MPKDDIVFDVEWHGLDEFLNELDSMDEDVDRIILEEMTKFGLLAEEGAKALAPHDEGELEDSINFDRATKEGKEYVVRGGSNLVYALRRHEEPYQLGVRDKQPGDRYYVGGRGRGTLRKPPWRGYRPGRKYLENAIKGIEPDYDRMNTRILERILGEKK